MKNSFWSVLEGKKIDLKWEGKKNKNQVIPEGSCPGSSNARSCKIKGKIPELVSGSSTHAVAVVKQGNPLFNKQQTARVEDPETSSGILYFTTTKANGFTLIELLVVVLIIGILAAVALPQYQVAVAKARFSNLRSMASSLANAAHAYYLANGHFPEKFDEMDVDLPGGMTISSIANGSCGKNEQFYCCINDVVGNNSVAASVTCAQLDKSFGIRYALAYNKQICLANPTNKTALSMCASIGTRDGGTKWASPDGYGEGASFPLN